MKKEEYTFDILLNDILSEPPEDNEMDKTGDIAGREYSSKLIVIQMLIGLAELYKTENYKDDEKLNNAIEIKVNGDELLSGYMFFISQIPQFSYLWSYMRKCKKDYKKFLVNSINFLNNVLVDINTLYSKPLVARDIHVVFHEILDVKLIGENPFVKTRLLWENFYRLATVKSEYSICIKVKESLLKIGCRKNSSDMEIFIDSALETLKNTSKKKIEQKNETI
ncbi:hypothetical protein [uncultured Alistipes sp.]|uniref:hypothetical protein n=1 Tax=uncultured Alistipes sp. TaxID=538949 RepID=UPI0025E47F13|nr:hypothetical protein [uncultured Alistipes sp.]